MVFLIANDPGVRAEQVIEHVQQPPVATGLLFGGSLAAWTSAFDPGARPAQPRAIGGMRVRGHFQANEIRTMFRTDERFDLAIQGHGFLKVLSALGETAYTRDGALQVAADGALMTVDGAIVEPRITIPRDAIDVSISTAGAVQVRRAGAAAMQTVGQIRIATFANEAGLEAAATDRFVETRASGAPSVDLPGKPGFGMLLQGYVEAADTSPIDPAR